MFDLLAEITQKAPAGGIGGSEALVIGTVIAAFQTVVEVVKATVAKRKNGNGGNGTGHHECAVCKTQLSTIHSVVTRTDANGAPLVYGHRELSDRIADNTRAVGALTDALERLVHKE